MSDLYLVLALVGTFAAVVLLGLSLQMAVAERRRGVEVLQSQVGAVPQDPWAEEMAKPFWDRAMRPLLGAVGRAGRRITPVGARDRIARRLVLAGSPAGWDAERVAALKAIGLAGGVLLGLLISSSLNRHGLTFLVPPVLLGAFGFVAPSAAVGQMVVNRQELIRRSLPDTMDLLTISVEAGLGFDAALAHVAKTVPGPLSQEISRMLREVQLGVSRVDAFRHLSDRTDVDELNAFTLAMIQADLFGVSISKVLRSQAKEQRIRRRQRAERKSQQIPTKMLFPLIFCILPALLVVIAGPGIIKIAHSFFGIHT